VCRADWFWSRTHTGRALHRCRLPPDCTLTGSSRVSIILTHTHVASSALFASAPLPPQSRGRQALPLSVCLASVQVRICMSACLCAVSAVSAVSGPPSVRQTDRQTDKGREACRIEPHFGCQADTTVLLPFCSTALLPFSQSPCECVYVVAVQLLALCYIHPHSGCGPRTI